MGISITFDTLAYSKELQSAGIPAPQAEAMAKAQSNALEKMVQAQDVATKSYLYVAIAQVKHDIIKWVLGIALAQTVIIIAVMTIVHTAAK